MIKYAIAASTLLLSTTALAQTAQPTADPAAPAGPVDPLSSTTTTTTTDPATPTTTTAQPAPTEQSTTTPSGVQPAQPATPADPSTSTSATPATPASPAQQDAATGEQGGGDAVATTVEADWAKYDTNSGGTLSRTEFNKWVTDLQTAADKKAPTRGYLNSAFRKADSDKNGNVSKEELQTFLRG
ncbi:hypothetical protein [Sphingomonas arenae]|uniref:hypothetical protein n=1 Tax=Sphingomonas arenae TaxID=2812555 RepID=UPI0019675C97|nr:hypothetical protein [Sphingomonas arenae]